MVTYFVAGCDAVVEEINADSQLEAALIYAKNNGWIDQPEWQDGSSIWVVAKSKVTEKTFWQKEGFEIQ